MARHALVALDGSESAWEAFDYALDTFDGEQITVLTVVDPIEGATADAVSGYDEVAHQRAIERGERLCTEAEQRADAAGALETTVFDTAIESGRPAQSIVSYAEAHDVDHIVVGSHGRTGLSRILLGSVAELVVRRASVPVTVVR